MMTVFEAAAELHRVIDETQERIVQLGMPGDQSDNSNLFKCMAIMVADAASNVSTLHESYECLPDDSTRYALIYQIGVRLSGASFLSETAVARDRELSQVNIHSLLHPFLVRTRRAHYRLEEAWKFYNTNISIDTLGNDPRFSHQSRTTFEQAERDITNGDLKVPKFD